MKTRPYWAFTLLAFTLFFACQKTANQPVLVETETLPQYPAFDTVPITYEVTIGRLFGFLDSLVAHYDTLTPYPFSEHLLVRANPWLIDSLQSTDYYRLKERGIFSYDNRLLVMMRPGDTLFIPHEAKAKELLERMKNTVIDLNIPEFRLRILEYDSVLYSIPVRVGQNRERYLLATDRATKLRTKTGEGAIVRHSKDPFFMDPVDGRLFNVTKRDDEQRTRMPLIPWIEPELNGHRYGHLIHPTSNLQSLGKAYSNGCVGTSEADAWRIYYYAPLGTRVVFRYDLKVVNEAGDSLKLRDVYGYSKKVKI